MPRIFISYDRDDRPLTRQLAAQLRRVYGFDDIWYDENIYGGTDWWEAIRSQINDCDIFMFMLSHSSAKSPYCEKERVEAEKLGKHILPVRIAAIPNIPEVLRKIQYVDMSEGKITVENFTELNAAIKQLSDALAAAGARPVVQIETVTVTPQAKAPPWRWIGAGLAVLVLLLVGGVGLVSANLPLQDGVIAFTSNRDDNLEIYLFEGGLSGWLRGILGDNPHNLSSNNLSQEESPAWSPDGQLIAFVSDAQEGERQIFIGRANGSGTPQRLASGITPAWSPDGTKIAYAASDDGQEDRDIFVMNRDGSNPINLTQSDADESYPTWSPDGTQIAFQSRSNVQADVQAEAGLPEAVSEKGTWDIFVIGSDGSGLRNLTNDEANDVRPAWSPDGQLIAFTSNRERIISPATRGGDEITSADHEIYVINSDGSGEAQDITNHTDADTDPNWSPDGTRLAFASDRDGHMQIYVLETACIARGCDVDDPRLLAASSRADVLPAWRP